MVIVKDKQSIVTHGLAAEYTGIIKALELMLLNKIAEDKKIILVRDDSTRCLSK